MAITQISRITHRKGLNENLPQLAGAELGWALDERRLYIGNGKTEDGAPTIGNTEILTEYSNILGVGTGYTYKGSDAGYTVQTGVDANSPVSRSLQEKFDDFASVKDFGATGDGSTDDTDAINRALSQLFVQNTNPKVRRSLFFPAGVYKVTGQIKIPTYAKLWGEGAKSSVIKYYSDGSVEDYVARTSDSKNQVGVNIGNNSAVDPTDIEISSMGFESTEENDILFIEKATDCTFEDVLLKGPLTTSTIDASKSSAGIRIEGTTLKVPTNITFNNIVTEGTGFGLYSEHDCTSVTLSNSKIIKHYKGVVLGDSTLPSGHTGPQAVRVQQCLFDDIHNNGIDINNVNRNVSAYNIFLDVGNSFNGSGNPSSTIININDSNNLSIGDLFERNDTDNGTYQRVFLTEAESISFDDGTQIQLGTFSQDVGKLATLADNTSAATEIFSIDLTNTHTNSDIGSFNIKYSIKRDGINRMGNFRLTAAGSGSLTYEDDYTENGSSGIVLSATQSSDDVSIKFTSTSTGQNAKFSYSVERLY